MHLVSRARSPNEFPTVGHAWLYEFLSALVTYEPLMSDSFDRKISQRRNFLPATLCAKYHPIFHATNHIRSCIGDEYVMCKCPKEILYYALNITSFLLRWYVPFWREKFVSFSSFFLTSTWKIDLHCLTRLLEFARRPQDPIIPTSVCTPICFVTMYRTVARDKSRKKSFWINKSTWKHSFKPYAACTS